MNLNWAWTTNWRLLLKAQVLPWIPLYRPFGALVYRCLYEVFGFDPRSLAAFNWLVLLVNIFAAYRLFRTIGLDQYGALPALALITVHGAFRDLYTNGGTIYDRLWFLFTALGLTVYARGRRRSESIPAGTVLIVGALCLLAMDSKESGVALPACLALYECVFVLPSAWNRGQIRSWLRRIAPLYVPLLALSLLHIFGRVRRTPELLAASSYHPTIRVSFWLAHVAEYLRLLTYGRVPFTPALAAVSLTLCAAAAIRFRDRTMIFGLIFWTITITPVALIAPRPGYVLYVPALGLAVYVGAIFSRAHSRTGSQREWLALSLVVILGIHAWNWPAVYDAGNSPVRTFTEYLRREYPVMEPSAHILFVTDDFSKGSWTPLVLMRLFYRDPSILVYRLDAAADQRPDPAARLSYDHVFTIEMGRYVELDNRDVAESARLHILRNVTVGRQVDFGWRDRRAYIISGVWDHDGPEKGRWMTDRAQLKFDVYPADCTFWLEYVVADEVAAGPGRVLSIDVDDVHAGSVALGKAGLRLAEFAVPAKAIRRSGFTIVTLHVDNPYRAKDGAKLGVILMRAGFRY